MLLAAIFAFATANAQTGDPGMQAVTPGPSASNFGAGLVIGDPTGVSLGWRPSAWSALELGVGWDLIDQNLTTSLDYLQSFAVVEPSAAIRVPLYVGIGAGLTSEVETFGQTPAVSARVPVGFSVLFMNAPVELFAHAIPTVRVLPETRFNVDAALGARYYF